MGIKILNIQTHPPPPQEKRDKKKSKLAKKKPKMEITGGA